MKKYRLIMCLLTIVAIHLKAQQINYDNIVSPEAYQFTKYTDMPVSEYTGIPNISIPLYTIEVKGGYSLPINLTYHAKGVAVEEEASEIGMGWNMNFGSIIQYVKGENDLDVTNRYLIDYHYTNPYIPWNQDWSPYYGFCGANIGCTANSTRHNDPIRSYSFSGDFSRKTTSKDWVPINEKWFNSSTLFPPGGNMVHAASDSAPDIFKASFLGEEVTFIFNFKNKHHINDIIPLTPNYKVNKIDDGFLIINPEGVKYFFEAKITHYSTPRDHTSYNWYLSKIDYPNKEQLVFHYDITSSQYENVPSSSGTYKLRISDQRYVDSHGRGIYNYLYSFPNPFEQTSFTRNNRIILKQINFSNGTISFNSSNREDLLGAKKIDKITVKDFAGKIKKEIAFSNRYVVSSGIENAGHNKMHYYKRLFLNAVKVGNQVYHFNYNNILLPDKKSFSKDYWGYYNGKKNTTSTPNPKRILAHVESDSIQDNGNDKRPNLSYAKAGVLEKITYPTGGTVALDYEFHEFDFPLATRLHDLFKKGNGLRVKKITHFDRNQNKTLEKSYQYEGGSVHRPSNFFKGPVTISVAVNTRTHFMQDYYELYSRSIYQSSPLGSSNSVGYSKVIVDQNSIQDPSKSYKIESIYENNDDKYVQVANSLDLSPPSSILNDKFIDNGKLTLRKIYNSDHNKLKEETYQYKFKLSDLHYGSEIIQKDFDYAGVSGGTNLTPLFNIIYYPIYTKETLLEGTTVKEYLEGGVVETKKAYRYDAFNRLKGETHYNSKGQTLSIVNQYPETDTDLHQENRLLELVSKSAAINGSLQPGFKKYYEKNEAFGLTLLDREINCSRGVPYPHDPEKCTNRVYDRYDKRGNVLQYHTEIGVNEKDQSTAGANTGPLVKHPPVSLLWDSSGQHPIAQVEGATYDEISSYTNNPDGLREALPNARVTTYEWEPLVGVTRITGPNGQTQTFTYDDYNRLEYILDRNGKVMKRYRYNYQDQKRRIYGDLSVTLKESNSHALLNQSIGFNVTKTSGSNNLRYTWKVNGATQSTTGSTLNKTFNSTGNHTVSVEVKDNETGQSLTLNKTVYVYNSLNTPTLSSNYTHLAQGTTVRFTGGNIGNGSGSRRYEWYVNNSKQNGTSTTLDYQFGSTGTYAVKLRVVDTKIPNHYKEVAQTVYVHNPLSTPTLSSNYTYLLKDTTVRFTGGGIGNGSGSRRYEWYVSNVKQSGTSTSLDYQFNTTGTYTVKFRVVDTKIPNHYKEVAKTVYVYNPMNTPTLSSYSTYFLKDTTARFAGSNIGNGSGSRSYEWYVNNVRLSETSSTLYYKFHATGTYTIKLLINDTKIPYHRKLVSKTVYVYHPLNTPKLSYNYTYLAKGTTVNFGGVNIGNGSGSRRYEWYVNNVKQSGTTTKLNYQFTTTGTYTVKFRVRDTKLPNHYKEVAKTVYVYNPLNTPSLSSNYTYLVKNTTVRFTGGNIGNGSGSRRYEWYVNNVRQSGTSATLDYRFGSTGTYTVKFRVRDTRIPNHYRERSKVVYVYLPTLSISSKAPHYKRASRVFSLNVSGYKNSVVWWSVNFGDGSSAKSGNGVPPSSIVHTFGKTGTFTVTFKVKDRHGRYQSVVKTIKVEEAYPRITSVSISGEKATVYWSIPDGSPNTSSSTWVVKTSYDNGKTWSSNYAGGSPRTLTLTQDANVQFKVYRISPLYTSPSAVYTKPYVGPKVAAFTAVVDYKDPDPYADRGGNSVCVTAGGYAANVYISKASIGKIREGTQLYIDQTKTLSYSNIRWLPSNHRLKTVAPNGVKLIRFVNQTNDNSTVWKVDANSGKIIGRDTRNCSSRR